MDVKDILLDCACLSIDLCVLALCYKLYKDNSECLKSLKEAQCLEISKDLSNNIETQDGVIPYAVITGKVKALSLPLQSKHFSYLQGVVQERIIKEHKMKWNNFLRVWTTSDDDIKRTLTTVPFALSNSDSGLFKKKLYVEIVDPLSSEELTLPTIYDDFKMHDSSLGEAIFGFVRGERTVGVVEIENMLLEETSLTAVGKLIMENGKIKMTPPDHGLKYFLTPMSLESLLKKVRNSATTYKHLTFFMCVVSTVLASYVFRKLLRWLKRKLDHVKQLKKYEEERRLRRMMEIQRTDADEHSPKCVVCLDNPVEALILECGHACLCMPCSERIDNLCPVCRTEVQRIVLAFLP